MATTGKKAGPVGAQASPYGITADDTFSRLLQLVRTVQAGMQSINPSHGLSGSQLWALWHISALPGLKVSELARAMQIHHSTASNMLDKLEKQGLAERVRQRDDSRVVRLNLTRTGEAIVKDIPGPLQGRLRRALQRMPRAKLDGLNAGIAELLEILDLESRGEGELLI